MVGIIYRIVGTMAAQSCINILSTSLVQGLEKFGLQMADIFFYYDNDPNPSGKLTKWCHGLIDYRRQMILTASSNYLKFSTEVIPVLLETLENCLLL